MHGWSNSNFFSFSSNNELREISCQREQCELAQTLSSAAEIALHEYQVEVITLDGDSETVYVEAHDADEAQEIAPTMVTDADYVMVQGVA